jgi:hypothetical protein
MFIVLFALLLCVAGWILGFSCIRRADSHIAVARVHLADCPFFSAPNRIVNYLCGPPCPSSECK